MRAKYETFRGPGLHANLATGGSTSCLQQKLRCHCWRDERNSSYNIRLKRKGMSTFLTNTAIDYFFWLIPRARGKKRQGHRSDNMPRPIHAYRSPCLADQCWAHTHARARASQAKAVCGKANYARHRLCGLGGVAPALLYPPTQKTLRYPPRPPPLKHILVGGDNRKKALSHAKMAPQPHLPKVMRPRQLPSVVQLLWRWLVVWGGRVCCFSLRKDCIDIVCAVCPVVVAAAAYES